jgi:hypothetical protein
MKSMGAIRCVWFVAWLLTQLGVLGHGINCPAETPNLGMVAEHAIKKIKLNRKTETFLITVPILNDNTPMLAISKPGVWLFLIYIISDLMICGVKEKN